MKKSLTQNIEDHLIGNIYKAIYGKMPGFYRKFTENYYRYADIESHPGLYFGFLIIYGVVLSSCILFLLAATGILSPIKAFFISFGIFVVFEVIFHYFIVLIAENRAKTTEEILPDVLKLMASNLRSGLTPDKALMLSAREEFGPMEKQIIKAAKLSLSGEPIREVLKVIPENIDSKVLRNTMELISEGMSKGGDLSELLDSVADDISRVKILKKEISAQVMAYTIFIFFASAIGAPVLYSISGNLVEVLGRMGKGMEIGKMPKTGLMNLNIGNFDADTSFLNYYSIASLVITSIFGGLLMGILKGGTEKEGIKYIPLFLGISIVVYLLSKSVVTGFLGGITFS